jgi:hypothetical protein
MLAYPAALAIGLPRENSIVNSNVRPDAALASSGLDCMALYSVTLLCRAETRRQRQFLQKALRIFGKSQRLHQITHQIGPLAVKMPVADKVAAELFAFAVMPGHKILVGFNQEECPRTQCIQNNLKVTGLVAIGNAKRLF